MRPTPWEAETHELSEGYSTIVYDANGQAIADHLDEPTGHLIASAPALYAALDALVPVKGLCTTNRNIPDETVIPVDVSMGELRKALAALAKARGEQP